MGIFGLGIAAGCATHQCPPTLPYEVTPDVICYANRELRPEPETWVFKCYDRNQKEFEVILPTEGIPEV